MQSVKEDQDLINQIQQKDKTVFEMLYKKYYKKLHVLSFQYVLNHEAAEEIVHDVFIKIWRMSEQLIIERSLEKYLIRSVINASLNYLTSEKQLRNKQDEYSKGQTKFVEETVNIEQTELLMTKLEAALDLLPPQCKKVMMLSRFEKLKQKNIAKQMGISIKTVKNHLTYGFNKLRMILENNTKSSMLILAATAHYITSLTTRIL
ncbi:MAG TPA: RNA polymerase sigma-70 factor [Sphingobacteriaceae bacterium]|nr:RNA polymerase sigma-70 factor [Sphingobacteriaceae bacterium]